MRRSRRLMPVFGLLLVIGSACHPSGATTGTAPPNQTPTATTPAVATPGHSAADADAAGFCVLAKEKGAQNLQVFDAQSTTQEEKQQVLRNIDALTAAAPDDIHADFVTFDEFEHKLFDARGEANGDLAQEAGSAELRDALTHIAAYLDKQCGIR